MDARSRSSSLPEIVLLLLLVCLLVGVLLPATGRCTRCCYGPTGYVFVTESSDGTLTCRTVASEIEATPLETKWGDIESQLEEQADYVLMPVTYGVRPQGGTFVDWRWSVSTRLDGFAPNTDHDLPTDRLHAAIDKFIRDATLPREDLCGIRTEQDREMLLVAWNSPAGTATRFDTLALIKNTAAWLLACTLVAFGVWFLAIVSHRSRQALAASQDPCLCSGCRYDLRGLPSDAPCPECGCHAHGWHLAEP